MADPNAPSRRFQPQIHIRPAIPREMPQQCRMLERIFRHDDLKVLMYAHRSEFYDDWAWAAGGRYLRRILEPEAAYLVAEVDVDKDGKVVGSEGAGAKVGRKVVGMAVWERENMEKGGTEWRKWSVAGFPMLQALELRLLDLEFRFWRPLFKDRSVDEDFLARFLEIAISASKRVWKPWPKRIHLALCGTDPDYQRMGVGAALVQWGIDWARKENVPAILEASPDGERLYEKLGFETVEMVGAPVMRDSPFMIWGRELGRVEPDSESKESPGDAEMAPAEEPSLTATGPV